MSIVVQDFLSMHY